MQLLTTFWRARQAGTATVIEDRAAAIAWTIAQRGRADVILIAGKGHEDYQEIAGERLPFSDYAVASARSRRGGHDDCDALQRPPEACRALHGDDRSSLALVPIHAALRDGELFFALQGPNFDGRDYVAAARKAARRVQSSARLLKTISPRFRLTMRSRRSAGSVRPGVIARTFEWLALPAATARRR